jgi:hypothetical protein
MITAMNGEEGKLFSLGEGFRDKERSLVDPSNSVAILNSLSSRCA